MDVNNCNKYEIEISGSKFKCIEANGEQGQGFLSLRSMGVNWHYGMVYMMK